MAIASLLRMGGSNAERAVFGFEHAMAHRQLYASMSPLSQFSVLPYLIDPPQVGGKYALNHQQAHWDFLSTLPSFPPGIGVIDNPDGSTTVPTGGLAQISDPILLTDPVQNSRQFSWWLFANKTAHDNALTVLELEQHWNYPFW